MGPSTIVGVCPELSVTINGSQETSANGAVVVTVLKKSPGQFSTTGGMLSAPSSIITNNRDKVQNLVNNFTLCIKMLRCYYLQE